MNLKGPPTRALRVIFYAQHLTGVGHFVRTRALATACAGRHATWLVSGGVPVPGELPPEIRLLHLPALTRRDGELVPLAAGTSLAATLQRRQAVLAEAFGAIRPDVLVIEHFPFSKWELGTEVAHLQALARAGGQSCRVICSVRDIPRQTRHEAVAANDWAERVLTELNSGFDGLMVHGDEALTPLGDSFPVADRLRLPWIHTGLVVTPCPPDNAAIHRIRHETGGAPYVLVSVGGGAGRTGLPAAALAAWREAGAAGSRSDHRLVVVHGLGDPPASDCDGDVIRLPFTGEFPHWLGNAALSVSHAGYNTCTALLLARSRALLIPDPAMSDQAVRAERLAALGLADRLDPAGLTGAGLAARISRNLALPRPSHDVPLDGAERSIEFLEAMAA